jgi:hypothetical protein
MRFVLPSLTLALSIQACDGKPASASGPPTVSDAELEALQQAEALRYRIDQQHREQQRLDALLGTDQLPAR